MISFFSQDILPQKLEAVFFEEIYLKETIGC